MSDEILRPTPERVSKADHTADDGAPTKEKPYIRPVRLGRAWDRYSRDRDSTGKLLNDEDMILTRRQIATGTLYLNNHEASLWGLPVASRQEVVVSASHKGAPVGWLDKRKELTAMESRLNPRYLLSLIQAVLIEGYSAEVWASATGRHPKSGIELLRVALDAMDCA